MSFNQRFPRPMFGRGGGVRPLMGRFPRPNGPPGMSGGRGGFGGPRVQGGLLPTPNQSGMMRPQRGMMRPNSPGGFGFRPRGPGPNRPPGPASQPGEGKEADAKTEGMYWSFSSSRKVISSLLHH